MFRGVEIIWDVRHVMERATQQFCRAADGDVVYVFANAELTDQFIVRFEAGRDGFGNLPGQVRFAGQRVRKNLEVQPVAIFVLAVDAIQKNRGVAPLRQE